jgi:hypothetical protein
MNRNSEKEVVIAKCVFGNKDENQKKFAQGEFSVIFEAN